MALGVVDASFIMAWLLKEPTSDAFDRALEAIAVQGAHVPGIFMLELANVLANAHRHHVPIEDIRRAVANVWQLPLEVDRRTSELAMTRIMAVATRHGLSVYDAAYLELAMRLACPLMTLDRQLIEAAKNEGLLVLPGS